MANPFLGEIRPVPFNFAPVGWAMCDGQILSISQNTALFSLLGTQYGGNGTSNFALPNLQGQVPIGFGQGAGLTNRDIGETVGVESVTLVANQIGAHAHVLNADSSIATTETPTGNMLAVAARNIYGTPGSTAMSPNAIAATGSSQAHENRQPFLVINFIIALQGIFPSRG